MHELSMKITTLLYYQVLRYNSSNTQAPQSSSSFGLNVKKIGMYDPNLNPNFKNGNDEWYIL